MWREHYLHREPVVLHLKHLECQRILGVEKLHHHQTEFLGVLREIGSPQAIRAFLSIVSTVGAQFGGAVASFHAGRRHGGGGDPGLGNEVGSA